MTNIPLYACSTCSHEYPSSASSCPSCGTKIGTAICPHCGNIVMEGDTCYCNAEAPYDDAQLRDTPYEEDVPTVYEDPYSSSYDTPFELPYDNSYIAAQDSSTDIAPMFMLEDDTDYVEEDCTPYYVEDPTGPEKEDPYQETKYCPCDESAGSSQSNMGCVDFSISFGRFPSFPELSAGKLTLYSTMLDRKLGAPESLNYEHIIQRSINAIQKNKDFSYDISGLTEKAYPRFYHFEANGLESNPLGITQIKPERIQFYHSQEDVAASNSDENISIREVLSDGTQLFHVSTPISSSLVKIITPNGISISKSQLEAELKIIRYSSDNNAYVCNGDIPIADKLASGERKRSDSIVQIWNKADGLLWISDYSKDVINSDTFTSYTISWYAACDVIGQGANNLFNIKPNATPIKSWRIEGEMRATQLFLGIPEHEQRESCDFAANELKYLSQLKITEQRGNRLFYSRWEQRSFSKLLFTKGTGIDAEQCLKIRTVLEYASADNPDAVKNASGPDMRVIMIGSSYVLDAKSEKYYHKGENSIEDLCSLGLVPCYKYESERIKRFDFGDVVIHRASGSSSALDESAFAYYEDKNSLGYGLLKEEVKSNGLRIHNQYDSKGRLSIRTETCDNFKKITYNAYCNIEFNDRRIARTDEFLEINGVRRHVATTQYIYEKSPALVRHTIKHVAHLSAEQPEVSFTEWYGVDMSLNGAHSSHAIGRIKRERRIDGLEVLYTYHDSEEEGIAYICRQTQCYEGLSFPNSKQTSLFYNAQGDIVKRQERAHI